MTLPTGSLSMSQIATELGLSLPLSLQHGWVRALAQVGGAASDFNSLRGKTGRFDGAEPAVSSSGGVFVFLGSAPWFGGQLDSFNGSFGGPGGTGTGVAFDSAPNWTGNIKVINNTTGVSVVLPKINSLNWGNGSPPTNLIRVGNTDSFTILPSA